MGYMILKLAIGGNLGGSAQFYDDQIMEIDYVRVYCLDGTTTCPQVPEDKSRCEECSGNNFCSPRSGTCYEAKNKDYYESCSVTEDKSCCDVCSGNNFCSPRSGT